MLQQFTCILILLQDTEHYIGKSYESFAPCVLPDLDSISKVSNLS